MNINRQFQNLHAGDNTVDWVLKQQVERDICLLYHQLARYSSIMGDLYYGSVYSHPYWEYLNFEGLDSADMAFIRNGCLVMILAMAWDQIDGSSNYIHDHIPAIRNALPLAAYVDEETDKLVQAVQLALDLAEKGERETQQLLELSAWVHKQYVRGYFRKIAQEFDTLPYFQD